MATRSAPFFHNPAFEQSLALLTHPFSLGAMGLLLVNDSLLRRLVPSWWTGKLGDAAWLFFTPFVLAALLSWLVPHAWSADRRPKVVFSLSYILPGACFSALKLVPGLNSLATRIFAGIFHAAPSLSLDPSDLLALPALALSAWWSFRALRQAATAREKAAGAGNAPAPVKSAPGGDPLRWIALPCAALILLADAAAPNLGITCLAAQDGRITASGGYNASYVSEDGGLHWSANQPGAGTSCQQNPPQPAAQAGQWVQKAGPTADSLYRYQPGQEIQYSTDGGKNWQPGIRLAALSEAERMYYLQTRQGNPVIQPGPLDAAPDPASGNMLFAMGQQGVLVHTAQGQWVWSMGGEYARPENFPNTEAFSVLLGGMVYLAAGLVLLVYCALALRWTRRWPRILVLALGAAAWLAVTILFPPATSYGYAATITLLGILAVIVLLLPLAIEQTIRLARRAPRAIPRIVFLSLAGGLLFLLPYILWLYSTLPGIGMATIFALLIAFVILAAGIAANRRTPISASPAAINGTIAADAKDHPPVP